MILFGDIIVYTSAFIAWLFVWLYAVKSHGTWKHSHVGWHLMSIAFVEGMIFTELAIVHWFPVLVTYAWFRWFYLSSVAGLELVTAWRIVILLRVSGSTVVTPVSVPPRRSESDRR